MAERLDRFDGERHAPGAVKRAKHLRRHATLSEPRLWDELRCSGLHMRRQVPMGRYVLDFVCHAARLVIELDGGWHREPERQLRDLKRDEWLGGQGYRVLRFDKERVFTDLEGLMRDIEQALAERTLPPRWGKGRDGGAGARSGGGALGAAPLELDRARGASTPTQPSPLEGEGS